MKNEMLPTAGDLGSAASPRNSGVDSLAAVTSEFEKAVRDMTLTEKPPAKTDAAATAVSAEKVAAAPVVERPKVPDNLTDLSKAREAEKRKAKLRQVNPPNKEKNLLEDDDLEPLSPKSKPVGAAKITDMPAIPKKKKQHMTAVMFALCVLLPTAVVGYYYAFLASPQYVVEAQFAVRGSSSASIATLGLSMLTGSSSQTSDSYIVTDYIESSQLLNDLKTIDNIDLRSFYARDFIDFAYRTPADMPPEEFLGYWKKMVDVSYNSTTGNITIDVKAFTSQDAQQIADAVMAASSRLVNALSEESRNQMTKLATKQVERSEQRLREIRQNILDLREKEKAFDPSQIAALESSIVGSLEGQLTSLKTRYNVLLESVSPQAPNARVLERQITALESQIQEQKARLGNRDTSATNTQLPGADSNLAAVFNKFEELTVEQNFATTAYTTSLATLENALLEAQKQERYFATFVQPTAPSVALYPLRMMNTMIAFLMFLTLWAIGYFVVRSIRDHAI